MVVFNCVALNLSSLWSKLDSTGKFMVYGLIFWSLMRYINDHSKIQHIGFISATYYKNSSLYPPDTVVILFNSQISWNPQKLLICESWSEASIKKASESRLLDLDTIEIQSPPERTNDLARVRYAFLPNFVCGWTTYIAVCKVETNPIGLSLSDTRIRSVYVNVPIRQAYEPKHDVISCFSPLFYNERWQLIIPSLEIYRQYGVGLQVYYVQSIREEIFSLLKAYQAAESVEIEPWILMNLGPAHKHFKDPNKELEWRNQAGAHTDCFLKYREAAEFIIVADIDDILFPRLGKNYMQEFQHLAARYPSAAGFTYNRYNTQVVSSRSPFDFSLFQLIDSARIADEWEDGKSVIRPSRVQTIWIHWPSIIESSFHMITVPEEKNFMVHFRNWTMTDFTSIGTNRAFLKVINLHDQQMTDIIRPEKAEVLETNAERFIADYAMKEFEALPTDTYYYPLIEECYNRIFYSKSKRVDTCPGPLRCDLPTFVPGVSCIMAQRNQAHQYISGNLEIHYPLNEDGFESNPNGCRM